MSRQTRGANQKINERLMEETLLKELRKMELQNMK